MTIDTKIDENTEDIKDAILGIGGGEGGDDKYKDKYEKLKINKIEKYID